MPLSFEVRDTDLLGRIGTLTVGGKKVETPCLLPVIHPVRQSITTAELKKMGFQALMTNSYIIYRRRKEEALQKKIHSLLGFDGVFMTDSGGYQVLEYGSVEISYDESARFQSSIGSDLAVTLDRPTGYTTSEARAKETMMYSLRNAEATMKEFGESITSWVGPIQGGLFDPLLKKSAVGLVAAGFKMLALGSPVQVMDSYRFAELVGMILAARRSIPYSMPLHLFGAGHPLTMALSVALGCDTFDSASYVLFAKNDRYMTENGILRLGEMTYLPCSCVACVSTTPKELGEMPRDERTRALALHNLHVLRAEMLACREAITEGRLWDLVQVRCSSHPRLTEAFSVMAGEAELLSVGTRHFRDKGLMVRSAHDLGRPEVLRSAARLDASFRRGSGTALLLVGGDQIPIGEVKGPAAALGRRNPDVFRLHPVLGVYPAELDYVYPFTQTVAALHPQPGGTEAAKKRLRRLGYKKVEVWEVGKGGRAQRAESRSRRSR
jgi:7-cyano-7-deazaguanine tRNA-ribosyltransferase